MYVNVTLAQIRIKVQLNDCGMAYRISREVPTSLKI